jgi:hypothetical protein
MDKNMNKLELYIKDSNFGHCMYSNNPTPPVTMSKHIEWNRGTPPEDVDVVCTDYKLGEGNIVWLLEPYELNPGPYEQVKRTASQYKEIWTHDKDILNEFAHAKYYPVGGCWLKEEDRKIYDKTKMFSIIASSKTSMPGHKLRHDIVKASGNKIDAFGAYKPLKYKIDGLADYRYHFAIESSKKDFYFTEKLIDCLMSGTIPIYWGCPSIGNFFNTDGFIVFNDLNELKEKLKLCTAEFYDSKKSVIEENFKKAQDYILSEDWIYKNIIQK